MGRKMMLLYSYKTKKPTFNVPARGPKIVLSVQKSLELRLPITEHIVFIFLALTYPVCSKFSCHGTDRIKKMKEWLFIYSVPCNQELLK